MSGEDNIVLATLFIFGFALGLVSLFIYNKFKCKSLQHLADKLIKSAESDADLIRKNHEIELKKKKVEQEQFLENKWQKERLIIPARIQKATTEYRNEMDPVKMFLDEICELHPGNSIKWSSFASLKAAYNEWATRNGEEQLSNSKQLAERLKNAGCLPKSIVYKGKKTRGWVGITVDNEFIPAWVN